MRIEQLLFRTSTWLLGACLALSLTACGGAVQAAAEPAVAAASAPANPLRVVSTPNPNVFPLLLAMATTPNLPVSLVAVGTGPQASADLAGGSADALLSMTYTAAQFVTSGQVPDLQLVSVNFWSGFWMLAPASAQVTQFSQLAGHGVLVSGPTSGGKGGGPDLMFQAAAKRAGLGASSFQLCYLPVMQAAPMMLQQQPMNSNPACGSTQTDPPLAISLVEPAATGLVLQSTMSSVPSGTLAKATDFQSLFTGYTQWPQTQLPHGGVSVRGSVLADPSRQPSVTAVLSAYRAAADAIMQAKSNPIALAQIASTISAGISTYYGAYGLSIPAPVIAAALLSGDLVYRSDAAIPAVQSDLASFLTEVVGTAPPAAFYHLM